MKFLDKLLHRKSDEDYNDLPYYRDEKTDVSTRRFASFLYGVFALFVTLLVAAGLFFGSRAVYRALTGKSTNTTGTSENGTVTKPVVSKPKHKAKKPNTMPSTGDNVPLPDTGDPGM